MVRKGFLKEVTSRQELKELVMQTWAVGSRGHSYRLRAQPLQDCRGRKQLIKVKEQKGDPWDMSVVR